MCYTRQMDWSHWIGVFVAIIAGFVAAVFYAIFDILRSLVDLAREESGR